MTCGLHGITKGSGLRDTVKVPRSDDGRCAIFMFLRAKRDLFTLTLRPFIVLTVGKHPGPLAGGGKIDTPCSCIGFLLGKKEKTVHIRRSNAE